MSTTRRRIVQILPLSVLGFGLAACGERKAADPAANAPAAPAAPPATTGAPATGSSTTGSTGTAPTAATAGVVDEKEPQAVAVGYVSDASRADKAKFPKYEAGQRCTGCALYGAAPDAPMGPCGLFGGRQVAGPGWCSAWVKRA
jgi:hypothetical protein